MKLPIVRTVIATSSIVIYFKKRKLYVDDKVYKIRILPNKTVKVYQKDVVNVIGIVGTSMLCISIAGKVYFFAKDQIARHDITFKFKISKRVLPADTGNVNITDVTSLPADLVDIDTLPNTNVLQPKKKFPIRDIVWIAVAITITYYLGQRIDNLPVSGNDNPVSSKPNLPVRTTTQLTWWQRRGLPEWLINDMSDEGMYGQITRPAIVEDIEPIANPHPRRFVVILFTILNRIPDPTFNNNTKIPSWMYSPAWYLVQAIYRKFNK
jgi:hypothetical protein